MTIFGTLSTRVPFLVLFSALPKLSRKSNVYLLPPALQYLAPRERSGVKAVRSRSGLLPINCITFCNKEQRYLALPLRHVSPSGNQWHVNVASKMSRKKWLHIAKWNPDIVQYGRSTGPRFRFRLVQITDQQIIIISVQIPSFHVQYLLRYCPPKTWRMTSSTAVVHTMVAFTLVSSMVQVEQQVQKCVSLIDHTKVRGTMINTITVRWRHTPEFLKGNISINILNAEMRRLDGSYFHLLITLKHQDAILRQVHLTPSTVPPV